MSITRRFISEDDETQSIDVPFFLPRAEPISRSEPKLAGDAFLSLRGRPARGFRLKNVDRGLTRVALYRASHETASKRKEVCTRCTPDACADVVPLSPSR
jgi:hypothetical protein